MSKTANKDNNFRSLPPNFASLDSETRKAVEEQLYKQQIIAEKGYLPGDKRLKSGDRIEELYGD